MYEFVVFLHVTGAIVFALGHGTSVAVAFRLRVEKENPRIAALLDASSWGTNLMYVGLLLIIGSGIALGFMGDFWGQWWLWVSIGVLVVVMGAMYAMAAPFYGAVRVASGGVIPEKYRSRVTSEAAAAALQRLGSWRAPMRVTLIGGVGLLVILWLMVFQPGG
ncbi:MAG TPA: hypothetical protein PK781_06050 [Terrimesophilobacter sp.]|nr:hypothetical protein [Terrimesophilobacter sp.]HRQ00006.1 hypothetical protein [Terrimesophilobacter sp.]